MSRRAVEGTPLATLVQMAILPHNVRCGHRNAQVKWILDSL